MSNQPINENEFSGAPGGTAGTSNYQVGYGTPDYAKQESANFDSANNNKAIGSHSNTRKDGIGKDTTKQDVAALFSKKVTPTPDEVEAGIRYELGHQIKKDKEIAKRAVVANLRKDPKYYSGLKMLNIDDESMVQNMTENKHPNDAPAKGKVTPNIAETKKIFAELAKGKDEKYVVNSQICDVMKELWAAKKARNSWRG